MSATPTGSLSSALCRGLQIEYKAFARPFTPDKKVAVLYLVATCSYLTTGFTIFFEEDAGNFKLMEQPPPGVFLNLVTYYSTSWPATGTPGERELPAHIMITDAYGEHRVHVKPWN
jgi:hypothetical protein